MPDCGRPVKSRLQKEAEIVKKTVLCLDLKKRVLLMKPGEVREDFTTRGMLHLLPGKTIKSSS